MNRALSIAIAALTLAFAASARADLTPPDYADITLELTVDGQESLPLMRFFVTNCSEPIETSVLERGKTLTCNPKKGAVRIFAFREGDLTELFDLIRRDAGRDESASFLAKKGKTCGEVAEQDRSFLAKTQVTWVAARYQIEPGAKGGCKLKRISATTKTRSEFQAPASSAPAPAPSSKPTTPPPAPSSTPEKPVTKSGCGCRLAPTTLLDDGFATFVLALGLLVAALRNKT